MILLLQTDTLWGLSADARDCESIKGIYNLKDRPLDKNHSFLLLMSDWEMVAKYAKLPENLPLNKLVGVSLVLPLNENSKPCDDNYSKSGSQNNQLSSSLFDDCLCPLVVRNNTIGVRVPDSPFLRGYIRGLGYPLVSTSANLHGQPSPKNLNEVPSNIRSKVDLIIPNPDNTGVIEPSTILDLTKNPPVILRKGKNWKEISNFV